MTLTERYLRAVKEHLPRTQKDDVIAELSENLRAQMDDASEALGRPLDEAEQAALLKRFGNPMVVAARYRGDSRSVSFGRQLIGPELFPTYAKVLTINVVITVIVMATLLLIGGGSAWSSIYGGLFPIGIQFAIVTAIFILIDRRFRADPDRWDPFTAGSLDPDLDSGSLDGIADHLIGPAKSNTVSYPTSLLELGLSVLTLVVWLSIGMPDRIGFIAPGPGWADLYVPITGLLAVALVLPLVTLVRPTAIRFRLASRAAFDAAGVAILSTSLAIGGWVVLADGVSPRASLESLVGIINGAVRVSIAVAIVITAVSFVLEVRRLRLLPR